MYPKYTQKYSVRFTQQLMLVAINYFDGCAFNNCLMHHLLFVSANTRCLICPRLETGCSI